MDQRSFDAYNQTTISGTTVLSAIKNYQNQPIAVIVQTKAGAVMNYDAGLGAAAPDPTVLTDWEYAIAGLDVVGVAPSVEKLVTDDLLWSDVQNLNTVPATTKSETAYINPTAKFKCVLIYDINDEIVGVYAEQLDSTGTGAAANLLQ